MSRASSGRVTSLGGRRGELTGLRVALLSNVESGGTQLICLAHVFDRELQQMLFKSGRLIPLGIASSVGYLRAFRLPGALSEGTRGLIGSSLA